MAMQSNQSLDHAIHIRNLWFHNRAKRLGIYYDLTDEQLTELYVLQDGRCAYCGEPMVMKLGIGGADVRPASNESSPMCLAEPTRSKCLVGAHSMQLPPLALGRGTAEGKVPGSKQSNRASGIRAPARTSLSPRLGNQP